MTLFYRCLSDGAAEDKNRVEEKQRISRKDMKKSKLEWEPRSSVSFCFSWSL